MTDDHDDGLGCFHGLVAAAILLVVAAVVVVPPLLMLWTLRRP